MKFARKALTWLPSLPRALKCEIFMAQRRATDAKLAAQAPRLSVWKAVRPAELPPTLVLHVAELLEILVRLHSLPNVNRRGLVGTRLHTRRSLALAMLL